ncbi:large subunit ribosomal protein L30 [Limimonas halophila]|uniref:Large ribosomal subunit protein uL30 n=1 Tax=Limimonas halophila TaxID=1082479 RepID=A0A1G7ULC1_9PROT|nr:large subunit ribosomal protein L30 [Limimonas halophila]
MMGEQAKSGKTIRVTLVRGGDHRPPKQRATLRGLGLTRRGRSRVLEDTRAVRGMVAKVNHLVRVDE